jgi:hypothetical protein
MIIGSFVALNNLVSKDNIGAFAPLTNCIQTFDKICSCQKQRKTLKHDECNKIYINTVTAVAPSLVDYFKTKTTDEEIIFYHNGHNLIMKLKLR